MSLLFWRKTLDVAPQEAESVAVSEMHPLPVQLINVDSPEALAKIAIEMNSLPPLEGRTVTRMYKVPGVQTAGAYTAGYAFGTRITFHDLFRSEKCSGSIVGATFFDLDNEGSRIDVPLFVAPFTATADNAAFAPSASDLLNMRSAFAISTFFAWSANQLGVAANLGIWVNGLDTNLYTQLVTRGTPTIAAGSEPWIALTVVPD